MNVAKINKNNKFFYWLIPPFLLAFITAFFYYPSLNYPFQFDDTPNIIKFFKIRHLDLKSLFFSGPRWISYWLNTINYKIGQFNPFVYRILNLSFHIITGILVFYLIFLILSGLKKENFYKKNAFWISIFTALLFLLHSVQTQTISYVIQGQLEGLATLFVVSILLVYYLLARNQNKLGRFFLTILLIILAIISTGTKEIAIISPLLVMLLDWFFIAQGNWQSYKKRIPLQLLLFFIIIGFYIWLLKPAFFLKIFGFRHVVRNNVGNILTKSPNEIITPGLFFISQFKVILHYILIFLWPFNLSVEYDWKLAESFWAPEVIIPFIVLLFIVFLIFYLIKKDKVNVLAFAILWFFISVLPRSSFIPSPELLVDYKTYLASIGLLLLIAIGIVKLIELINLKLNIKNNNIFIVVFFVLVFLLGSLTYQRNKVWRSALEFWEHIVHNAPDKARGYNNYGVELSNLGRHQEAILFFKKAIKLEGETYWDPYTNLAGSYAVLGNMPYAIATLEKSLTINPYQPEAYNNLGAFLIHMKEFEYAEKSLKAALMIVPHYGKAMYNLGKLYLAKDDLETAWQYFKKACTEADLDHDLNIFQLYATTSIYLKKYDDAIFACKKFIELAPQGSDDANEAMFNLGNAYFLNKNLKDAAGTFEEMTKRYPQDIRGWCNLVESYIQMHKTEKALDVIKQVKKSGKTFPGLEVQQGVCMIRLGYKDAGIKLIEDFIASNPADNLKQIANKILNEIKKRV